MTYVYSTMKVGNCISQDIGHPGHAPGTNSSLYSAAMELHSLFSISHNGIQRNVHIVLFDECGSIFQENVYDWGSGTILLENPEDSVYLYREVISDAVIVSMI
jgi:hypothetical protein